MTFDAQAINDLPNNKYFQPLVILAFGLMVSLSLFVAAGWSPWGEEAVYNCSETAPLSDDCLKKYAQDLDLNMNKFAVCVDEDATAETVEAEIAAGDSFGVQGTPSILLGKGEGDEFRGFYVSAGLEYERLADLTQYALDNDIDATQTYWEQQQFDQLDEFEEQVRDYFESIAGDMTEKEINKEVEAVVEQRRGLINTQHKIQDLSVGDGVVMDKGEITLMLFSDFECPYCGQFARDTMTKYIEDYVDGGPVRFVFRDYPIESIHANAKSAAQAARCAEEQGKFFEYHDALYGIEEAN